MGGLNEFQDEDEEIGSNFVDFDDFNAEDIWQNEDSEELDEFDDGLYGLQDEDEEIDSNFDDSDDFNAEEILQNGYADKSDEYDNGLHVLEHEELEPITTLPIVPLSRSKTYKCPPCCYHGCSRMAICGDKERCPPKARED